MITENWAKSTYSGPNCDNCLWCRLDADGNVEVRHTKNPDVVLVFTPGEWDAHIKGAKDGQFDLPA